MVIVYSTFPNEEKAIEIGKKLLEEKLIACFNSFPIKSGYRWKGEIVDDEEFGVFFKTRADLAEKLMNRISELHPYELPAIFAMEPLSVFKPYEDWIEKETK